MPTEQANQPWSPYGDVTTILTKDADVKTGIGMRVTEKGHVVRCNAALRFGADAGVYSGA